jgi:hypothetical protein
MGKAKGKGRGEQWAFHLGRIRSFSRTSNRLYAAFQDEPCEKSNQLLGGASAPPTVRLRSQGL